jgi:transposase
VYKLLGAVTKFNDSLESVATALANKGHIDREIAEILGVSESALYEHKEVKLRQYKLQGDNNFSAFIFI